MPALIYQLVWQRSLFTIYGINVESVAVVVTGFMFGLGLGSLLGGQLSRTRFPLLAMFGVIELAIGAFGVSSLDFFDAVGRATINSHPVVVKLAPLGLLLLPTVLMGATLPILTMYVVRRYGNVGKSLGLLYFLNTVGSAVACFLVAFWVMRVLGSNGAVQFAALFNLVVGSGALIAQILDRKRPAADIEASTHAQSMATLPFTAGMALAAVTGYISLSYEILWFRAFSVASGSSALAFALVLGAFLAGVAGGSAIASRLCIVVRSVRRLLGALSGAILVGCLFGYIAIPLTGLAAVSGWLAMIGMMLAAVCVSAALIGAAFPLVGHLSVAPDERAGARVSYLYMANIAGAVLGSMLTGFFLMDVMKLSQVITAVSLIGLVLVAYLSYTAHQRIAALGSLISAILVLAAAPALFDRIYERLQLGTDYTGERYAHVLENRQSVITIDSNGVVSGGGMYDGMVTIDLVRDAPPLLDRPFSLSLWHPQPRQVLMIGLSMGGWAQIIANHPQVTKLTIVEINPGYLDLIALYPELRSLLANPKVQIVIDDGRRWLSRNPDRKFDVIVQNTTWHFRAHVSALLSEQYLALARQHLNAGGLMMWNTQKSQRAKKTGCRVFPHGYEFGATLMVGGNDPISPDVRRWTRVLTEYRIDGRRVLELSRDEDARRLARMLDLPREDCAAVLARTSGIETITDENMGDEWRIWRHVTLDDGIHRLKKRIAGLLLD